MKVEGAYPRGSLTLTLTITLIEGRGDLPKWIYDEVKDPVTTYDTAWLAAAHNNDEIHERCFPYMPNNHIRTLQQLSAEYAKAEANMKKHEIDKDMMAIKGHIFTWPIHFLKDANLQPEVGDTEYILPSITFT